MAARPALVFAFLALAAIVAGTPDAYADKKPVKAAAAAPAAPAKEAEKDAAADPDIIPFDDVVYSSRGEAVVFSHTAHVGGFGFACDACHPKLFAPKAFAAKAKPDFNMKGLDEGNYCGACHNGEKAFSTTDFESCDRCHAGKANAIATGRPPKGPKDPISLGADDSVAAFPHLRHESLACADCHSGLFPMRKTGTITSMDEINGGKACGSCHNGKKAFSPDECGKCHPKM